MADPQDTPLRPQARPASADPVSEAVADALSADDRGPLRPEARPDGPPSLPGEVLEAATVPQALDPDRLALIGLFHGPDGSSALLRLASGTVIRVAQGDQVAGGRVTAIAEDSLRLQQGGAETVLTLPG